MKYNRSAAILSVAMASLVGSVGVPSVPPTQVRERGPLPHEYKGGGGHPLGTRGSRLDPARENRRRKLARISRRRNLRKGAAR